MVRNSQRHEHTIPYYTILPYTDIDMGEPNCVSGQVSSVISSCLTVNAKLGSKSSELCSDSDSVSVLEIGLSLNQTSQIQVIPIRLSKSDVMV